MATGEPDVVIGALEIGGPGDVPGDLCGDFDQEVVANCSWDRGFRRGMAWRLSTGMSRDGRIEDVGDAFLLAWSKRRRRRRHSAYGGFKCR